MTANRGGAAFVVLVAALPGCATAQTHLMDTFHPWHAYPAWAGAGVGFAPFLPLGLAEQAVTGATSMSHTFFYLLGGTVGYVLGNTLGGAFYVVGSPLEFVWPLPAKKSATHERRAAPEEPPPEDPAPARSPD